MPLPPRKHFTLDEIAAAWGVDAHSLLHYGIEQQLVISVPVFGVGVEVCLPSETEDDRGPVIERLALSGARALLAADLLAIATHGAVRTRQLASDNPEHVYWLAGNQTLELLLPALVITAAERARFEAEYDLVADNGGDPLFSHDNGYRRIAIGGQSFTLSPLRAGVVGALHEAWLSGQPWMKSEAVLSAVGSQSTRIVDVFGPISGWRKILISDRQGSWRLNLPDEPVRKKAHRRAFRRPHLRLVHVSS